MNKNNYSIPSITFFYPSTIVGGAEYLYIRLAKYISESYNIPVYVLDYTDGFLRKNLEATSIKLVEFTDDTSVVIDYETIIVTPFCHLFKINSFKVTNNNTRVLFWSIHPTHFTNYFITRNWFITNNAIKKIGNAFSNLMQNGGMVYMDYPNYIENQNKLALPFTKESLHYLPICCNPYQGTLHQFSNNNNINVCWLGRIATDKVSAIENFAWHLNQLPAEHRNRINFIIIGNGEEETRLKSFFSKLDIRFEFKDTLLGDTLNEYLVKEIDLGVAMGTSLLEFAKLKIPVVMVDLMPYDTQILDNKFQWLYEAEGFSMGNIYPTTNKYKHNITDIINQITNEKSYNEIASACNLYYLNNHALEAVTNNLIQLLNNTSVVLPDKSIDNITAIMNPWYFRFLKKLKNQFGR